MRKNFWRGFAFGILTLACVIAGLVFNATTSASQARVHCSNFMTQTEAQAAYSNGATYLDGDGDGIACEGLLH